MQDEVILKEFKVSRSKKPFLFMVLSLAVEMAVFAIVFYSNYSGAGQNVTMIPIVMLITINLITVLVYLIAYFVGKKGQVYISNKRVYGFCVVAPKVNKNSLFGKLKAIGNPIIKVIAMVCLSIFLLIYLIVTSILAGDNVSKYAQEFSIPLEQINIVSKKKGLILLDRATITVSCDSLNLLAGGVKGSKEIVDTLNTAIDSSAGR